MNRAIRSPEPQRILRSEWRVLQIGEPSATWEDLCQAFGPDWSRYRPNATHVLVHRYIRRGTEEPWVLFNIANAYEDALGCIDNAAVPMCDELRELQFKRRAYLERQALAKAEAEAAKRKELERRELRQKSEATFRRLRDGKQKDGLILTKQWAQQIIRMHDKRIELEADAEFRSYYDAVLAAVTVPTKRKALIAFFQYVATRPDLAIS